MKNDYNGQKFSFHFSYYVNIPELQFKTTNGGISWEKHECLTNPMNFLRSIHFEDNNTGWIAGENGLILKTTDGGSSWFNLTAITTWEIYDIFFPANDVGYICGVSGEFYKTTDSGESWNFIETGLDHSLISIHFPDIANGWVGAGYGTILHTSDGGNTWEIQNTNLGEGIVSLHFADENSGWAISGHSAVINSTNGGITWENKTPDGATNLNALFPINSSKCWVVGDDGKIYHTRNGGIEWTEQVSNTIKNLYSIHFLDSLRGCVGGGNSTILRTNNGGDNWELAEVSHNWAYPVYSIFLTGEDFGWALSTDGVFYSNDSWKNWTYQLIHDYPSFKSIHFSDLNHGWVAGPLGYVFKTENGGIIVPVELTFFGSSVNGNLVTLEWDTATELNNFGFEVERTNVSEKKNEIAAWKKLGFISGAGTTTLPQSYSFVDKNVAAGKYLYRLKQIDNDGRYEYSDNIEAIVTTPAEFSLGQNYPNPFNPATHINYSITEPGKVTLKVFDSVGREVKTLLENFQEAGRYEIVFDAQGLANGIYIYSLNSGDKKLTKKMLLLK